MKLCGAMSTSWFVTVQRVGWRPFTLTDLGFVGLPFTYDNSRDGYANVKVGLDRAMTDTGWRDMFGDNTLHHLVSSWSDHCPLLLEIRKESWKSMKHGFSDMGLSGSA
jgi:hypothetical protein